MVARRSTIFQPRCRTGDVPADAVTDRAPKCRSGSFDSAPVGPAIAPVRRTLLEVWERHEPYELYRWKVYDFLAECHHPHRRKHLCTDRRRVDWSSSRIIIGLSGRHRYRGTSKARSLWYAMIRRSEPACSGITARMPMDCAVVCRRTAARGCSRLVTVVSPSAGRRRTYVPIVARLPTLGTCLPPWWPTHRLCIRIRRGTVGSRLDPLSSK